MKGREKKGAAVGTGSGIIVGSGRRRVLHVGPYSRLATLCVGILLICGVTVGTALYIQHRDHQKAQQAKNVQQSPRPGQIVVTQDQINQAQNVVALTGTVQSFDGTVIRFLANGSSQAVSVTVTASTEYTQGASYAPAKVSGLKAGSHAVVAYNQKTGKALNVSYGL